MKIVKILLADDHRVVIEGIKSALLRHPDLEVVGEAANGLEAVKIAGEKRPDVVVMDISMPDLNGIDATIQIRKLNPGIKIIVFTMFSDREYVIDLLKAGICGYVLKEDSLSELIKAIQSVKLGNIYFSSSAPRVLPDDLRPFDSLENLTDGFEQLSAREREVLQLLAEGHNLKAIAARLELSPKTVESHKYNIMEKLGVRDVIELTKIAIKKGLITP